MGALHHHGAAIMDRSHASRLLSRLGAGRQKARVGGTLVVILAVIVGQEITAFSRAPLEGPKPIATNALAKLPVGWTRLPRPPEVRDGAALLWTGSELLAWGGCAPRANDTCRPVADGFAFDPVNRSWRRVPEAPLAATSADAIWTGEEAIFLRPVDGRLGGQAYAPRTGRWRAISIAPTAHREGSVQVWTGSELIVWGGGKPGSSTVTKGVAYQPAADAWRAIDRAPIGLNLASGMWTGRELLVLGSLGRA